MAKPTKASPASAERPDAAKALAKQIPPANNNKTPQGILAASCQVISGAPSSSREINKTITAKNATDASLAIGTPNSSRQPPKGPARVIHKKAVIPKIMRTLFSALRHATASGRVTLSFSGKDRVNQSAAKAIRVTTMGSPHDIHWVKPMVSPVVSS